MKCKRPCQKARRARVRVVDVRLQHEVRIRPHRAGIEGGDRALGNRLSGKCADAGASDLGRCAAQLGRPRQRGADRRERCCFPRPHCRRLANSVRDLGRRAAQLGRPRKRGADRRELCSSPTHSACELAPVTSRTMSVRLAAPPSRSRRKKVPAQRACTHGAVARSTRRSRSPHAAAGRLRLGDCPRRQQGVPSQGLLALLGLRHEPDVQVRLSWQRLVHVCQDGLLGGAGLHVRRSERRHTGARAHRIS